MEFLKPKTSCKTLCFFLNVVMFLKNTDVDVFDDVLQNMQTMLMLEQRSFGVFHPPQIPYIYSLPPSSPNPPPRPPTSDLLIYDAHHHFQLPRLLLITISIKNFSHDQIRLHDVLCFNEHRQKTLTSISFQQHRQNIASIAKSMMF